MERYDVVIIGAGSAGLSAADELTSSRLSVCILSDESRAPYKRTKLSKHLASGFTREQFSIYPRDWYKERDISISTGDGAASINVENRVVVSESGRSIEWNHLILATGAKPIRHGNIASHDEYHVVRTADDAEKLRSAVSPGESALVVGAGVLGIEVAEQLVCRGLAVTVAASGERLMPKQFNNSASDELTSTFRSHGVELIFGAKIKKLHRTSDRWVGHLGGRDGAYDHLVFCGGSAPDIRLAEDAGILTRKGIVVDERLSTSARNVYAAGDVAEHPAGNVTHLWHEAEHQGRFAAGQILGASATYLLPPFRLKCEVFNRYFFSIGMPMNETLFDVRETRGVHESVYRCLYIKSGIVEGIVMIDEKERAKEYERAVQEGWSAEVFERASPV